MEEIKFKGNRERDGKEVYGYYCLITPKDCKAVHYILRPSNSSQDVFVWEVVKADSVKQFIGETEGGGAYNVYDGDRLIANDGIIYTIQWCQWENGWRFYRPDGSQACEMGYPHEELRKMELVKEKDRMSIDGRPGW